MEQDWEAWQELPGPRPVESPESLYPSAPDRCPLPGSYLDAQAQGVLWELVGGLSRRAHTQTPGPRRKQDLGMNQILWVNNPGPGATQPPVPSPDTALPRSTVRPVLMALLYAAGPVNLARRRLG